MVTMITMAVAVVFAEHILIGHIKAAGMFAIVVIKNIINKEKYQDGK